MNWQKIANKHFFFSLCIGAKCALWLRLRVIYVILVSQSRTPVVGPHQLNMFPPVPPK